MVMSWHIMRDMRRIGVRIAKYCNALLLISSHRIVSYRIVSYPVSHSHRIVSYRIVSYCIVSHRITSHHLVSYRTFSTASHRIVSYRIVSYHTAPHHIVSYRFVSYCIVYRIVSHRIVSYRIVINSPWRGICNNNRWLIIRCSSFRYHPTRDRSGRGDCRWAGRSSSWRTLGKSCTIGSFHPWDHRNCGCIAIRSSCIPVWNPRSTGKLWLLSWPASPGHHTGFVLK